MSDFYTRLNRRGDSGGTGAGGDPAPEPKQKRGWVRRAFDYGRKKLQERRQRRDEAKKPPVQEEAAPPPEPPESHGDISLRVRLNFTANTGAPGGRHYDDSSREIELTLWVSLRFVEVLRDLLQAGNAAEACAMLTEPWKTQYLLDMVTPDIQHIVRPHERAGARFFVTPTDVIE